MDHFFMVICGNVTYEIIKGVVVKFKIHHIVVRAAVVTARTVPPLVAATATCVRRGVINRLQFPKPREKVNGPTA